MELRDLRPCDACGGKLDMIFYRVTVSPIIIKPDAVNRTLGLAQAMGGSLSLAMVMGPGGEVEVLPDAESNVILCGGCYCGTGEDNLPLAFAVEKRNALLAEEESDG